MHLSCVWLTRGIDLSSAGIHGCGRKKGDLYRSYHHQLNFLANNGCDLVQGFLLARPMNEAAYSSFLQNLQASAEPLRLSANRNERAAGR